MEFVEVKSDGELASMLDSYSKNQWDEYFSKLEKMWQERREATAGMNEAEKEEYEDEHSFGWMTEQDELRTEVETNISNYSQRLFEENRNRKSELQKVAFTLSRFSPVSSYQLAGMNLASSDMEIKDRYEDVIDSYKNDFYEYVDKRQAEEGETGMVKISISSEGGFNINSKRNENQLDLSKLPKFSYRERQLSEIVQPAIIDLGILLLLSVLVYAGAFRGFLNYDAR